MAKPGKPGDAKLQGLMSFGLCQPVAEDHIAYGVCCSSDSTFLFSIDFSSNFITGENIMKKLFTTAVLTGMLAFGTVVSADEVVETTDPGTTPDEFLFTFDQLFEELKLLVTFDDEKEAQLLLDFASERLAEATAMSAEEKDEFLQAALEDYLAALDEAQDKVTEVIVEEETDSEGADELTEELEDVAEVDEELADEAEGELEEELEEAVEEAKVVANVVKGLDQDKVAELREQGLGYGQIAQIFWLAEAADIEVDEVAAIYTEEKLGFGQAVKQLGVEKKGLALGKKKGTDEEEAEEEVSEEEAESGDGQAEDGISPEEEGADTEAGTEQSEDGVVTEEEADDTASAEASTLLATAATAVKSSDKKTAVQPETVKAGEKKTAADKKAEEQKQAAAKKAEEQKQEAAKRAEEKKKEEARKAEEKKKEEAKKAEEKQREEAKKAEEQKQKEEAEKAKGKKDDGTNGNEEKPKEEDQGGNEGSGKGKGKNNGK
jgi:hypothetical protein